MYVCTAAERGYALEAWRLLDIKSDIIPDDVRAARIVCVPGGRKKELRRVLRVGAALKFESGVVQFTCGTRLLYVTCCCMPDHDQVTAMLAFCFHAATEHTLTLFAVHGPTIASFLKACWEHINFT